MVGGKEMCSEQVSTNRVMQCALTRTSFFLFFFSFFFSCLKEKFGRERDGSQILSWKIASSALIRSMIHAASVKHEGTGGSARNLFIQVHVILENE